MPGVATRELGELPSSYSERLGDMPQTSPRLAYRLDKSLILHRPPPCLSEDMDRGSPNDFLSRMLAGEFDGRLHEVLSELSTEQLQAIVNLYDRYQQLFGTETLKSRDQRVASWR